MGLSFLGNTETRALRVRWLFIVSLMGGAIGLMVLVPAMNNGLDFLPPFFMPIGAILGYVFGPSLHRVYENAVAYIRSR